MLPPVIQFIELHFPEIYKKPEIHKDSASETDTQTVSRVTGLPADPILHLLRRAGINIGCLPVLARQRGVTAVPSPRPHKYTSEAMLKPKSGISPVPQGP